MLPSGVHIHVDISEIDVDRIWTWTFWRRCYGSIVAYSNINKYIWCDDDGWLRWGSHFNRVG